jgi:DNA-binding NarL/FixJ family response regulator
VYYRALIDEYRGRSNAAALPADEAAMKAGLSEVERKVLFLLIEGETRRDISRRLKLTAAEVSSRITAIRGKLVRLDDPDPAVSAVADAFKLSRRETEMLRCLRRGMTNAAIAAELFISEGTVKVHVHNLLKKLDLEKRRDVAAWAEAFLDTGEMGEDTGPKGPD